MGANLRTTYILGMQQMCTTEVYAMLANWLKLSRKL